MTLKNSLLDAIIDGKIGHGITISREDFINYFSNVNSDTTGCFLSNSEIKTGLPHSPTYDHFTIRKSLGVYYIHPLSILNRMQERTLT